MKVLNKLNLKVTRSELKKVLGLSLVIALFASGLYVFSEPGIMSAADASSSVVVTLAVDTGISLTVNSATTAMSQHLGVVANSAVATSTFNVATNNYNGYTLTLNASSSAPAMQSATNSIPDANTTPTAYASLIPAGQYAFGFSAYSTSSTNVSTGTFGTQTTGCAEGVGTSTPSTGLLYRGFAGATPVTVASHNATTTTSGNNIVVCFVVGQNGAYIPSGNYNATITGTATTN